MEAIMTAPVSFTASAIKELGRVMESDGFDAQKRLRIGVKGGGCSGLSYVLGFDEKNDQDDEYSFGALPFVMNRAHAIYLMGMEIDWQDGLNARGFTFANPNASKTCGCGTSFAI